jgi:protoporphyrin/coproporphyrin ferrochelatase
MSSDSPIDAVLLIGFGGPASSDEIRPFLDRLLRGRPIPQARYEEVVKHYEAMGGRSPYNELTMRQAEALRAALAHRGAAVPVRVGMRAWRPFVGDVLAEMVQSGARRMFGFVLAAHRCEASWQVYLNAVREAQSNLGAGAFEIEYPEPWHTHPKFIEALEARAAEARDRLPPDERKRAELIFTAHSIPLAMARASRYVEEVAASSRMVAQALRWGAWSIAYQSRSGSPREPWLEPDIAEALKHLGDRPSVVVPVGFLCDHVEVLYDLDVAARAVARDAGGRMERAATVGDHPAFIDMMAEMVARRLNR